METPLTCNTMRPHPPMIDKPIFVPDICPSGWYMNGEWCYSLKSVNKTFDSARQTCLDEAAILAPIYTLETAQFLQKLR